MAGIRCFLFGCVHNESSATVRAVSFAGSILSICLAGAALKGCYVAADGVGLLPEPPAHNVKFSSYSPAAPFVQQAPGILSRRAFLASSGNGYRVEVQDLLIGPRQKPAGISFPGPAVIEVRSGNATFIDGDRRQDLKAGFTFSWPEGRAFSIDNRMDAAASLRAYVFIAE